MWHESPGPEILTGAVYGDDLERLPKKLMNKARQRILDYQKEQLDVVPKLAGDLQRARAELEKRLDASTNLEKLQQAVQLGGSQ